MRAMAITQPGMFLSQPPMATKPSMPSQPTTVSIESAMTSRDTSEYFMPSVPIEMPSEMVMVLKMMALPPAALTPLAALAGEFVDVHVAGRHLAPGRGDADLRFGEILFFETDGVEHGAARGAVRTIEHRTGKQTWRVVHRAKSIWWIRGGVKPRRLFAAGNCGNPGRPPKYCGGRLSFTVFLFIYAIFIRQLQARANREGWTP